MERRLGGARHRCCAGAAERRQRRQVRGDLVRPLRDCELVCEVKHHGTSFKRIYTWLVDRDLLPLTLAAEILEDLGGQL